MERVQVDSENPDRTALVAAAEAVLRGGVIAFPTDTVYGLGCSLFDVAAVEMIARLKRVASGLVWNIPNRLRQIPEGFALFRRQHAAICGWPI